MEFPVHLPASEMRGLGGDVGCGGSEGFMILKKMVFTLSKIKAQ